MVNLWKRCGHQLRRIMLLQFELITLRFAQGRDNKPIIFMISRFPDVSMNPEPILFIFGDPEIHLNKKTQQIILCFIILEHFRNRIILSIF